MGVSGTAFVKPDARRGRGAQSNASGRYEPLTRVALDDGWGVLDEEPPKLRTTVTIDTSRKVIARNDSPDVGFDRSINPYRGCEHGCIYCYARPTHAYLGLSPGLDFESRLFMKPGAPRLLARELSDPRYRCAPIGLGTNTDPYQPLEREKEITRRILEVLSDFNHPATIVTKSALICRDIDILAGMAERGLVKVMVSVTTQDRKLARRMEPRASTPGRRLEAIRSLTTAHIPTGVMVAPIIPGLTDWELESNLRAGAEAGATAAAYVLLRLPLEIRDLFHEWLAEAAPDRASRVVNLMRTMRGGKDYDATFGTRMKGTGPMAEILRRRFSIACRRLGLNRERIELDCSQFRKPPESGDQLRLF